MGREISTFPSDDAAFAEYVQARAGAASTPEELMATCHDWYPGVHISVQAPFATVLPDSEPTWYVFRDGQMLWHGEAWWQDAEAARIELDTAGVIVAANEQALALAGGALLSRSLAELQEPDPVGDPAWLWAATARHGAMVSVARWRGLGAAEGEIEFRVEAGGGERLVLYWRPVVEEQDGRSQARPVDPGGRT
jgi:PAS domain-containing protein